MLRECLAAPNSTANRSPPSIQRDLMALRYPIGRRPTGGQSTGGRQNPTPYRPISEDRIEAFAELMRKKLDDGDVQARRGYLRSVISNIEVDDDRIRVTGDKAPLAEVIAGRAAGAANVSSLVRKWRARNGSNVQPSGC